MARPLLQAFRPPPGGYSPSVESEDNVVAMKRGQLRALTGQLDRVCQTVHPINGNFNTYGHDIRSLLILACTEVEDHWRGVLVANGRTKDSDRYNTRDYVVLRAAMKLDEYAVSFPNYPWLPPFAPFKGWSTEEPTKSIGWYAAYNAAKHDRENRFDQATLNRVFEAFSACVIMMAAQFGLEDSTQASDLRSFCWFGAMPTWPVEEHYMPNLEAEGWSEVHFPFVTATS
jgi:hypothetical protein